MFLLLEAYHRVSAMRTEMNQNMTKHSQDLVMIQSFLTSSRAILGPGGDKPTIRPE